ncbi:MAG: TetR/AcrR family transcriptional regulator [Actinomycetota bacterium]|nr:TetR/AcrR family transcriptional regulator [Actinomycetota bacterium]
MTRGALYHHFRDKRDLFRAVHEQLEEEIVGRIGEIMGRVEDPVDLFRIELRAFLDVCTDREFSQIAP